MLTFPTAQQAYEDACRAVQNCRTSMNLQFSECTLNAIKAASDKGKLCCTATYQFNSSFSQCLTQADFIKAVEKQFNLLKDKGFDVDIAACDPNDLVRKITIKWTPKF